MGRKKKKPLKPWCWYCHREFDDEKILIQHQKAKHFKCNTCHKKLYTGPGLIIHCMQVHKDAVDKIPNCLPHRNNIEIEIYGMEGIPLEDLRIHEEEIRSGKKPVGRGSIGGGGDSSDDEAQPNAKKLKPDAGSGPPPQPSASASSSIPPNLGMPNPMLQQMQMMGAQQVRPGIPPPQLPQQGNMMQMPIRPNMMPMPGNPMFPYMNMMNPMGMNMMMMGMNGGMMMGNPYLPAGMNFQPPPQQQPPQIQQQQQQQQPVFPLPPSAASNAVAQAASMAITNPLGSGSGQLPGSAVAPAPVPSGPAFPAYSGTPSQGQGQSVSKTEENSRIALIPAPGAGSKLIHPAEDISLEERRARLPKYRSPQTTQANTSQSTFSAPPMLNPVAPPPSDTTLPGIPGGSVPPFRPPQSLPSIGISPQRKAAVGVRDRV